MAGDWIKVEKLTPDKPEMAILARKLGVSRGEAFVCWFRVYAWADGITESGSVPFLSLDDGDTLSGALPGTCAALASPEIGWISVKDGGMWFEKWDRHNGKNAKKRCVDREKKRKQRAKEADEDEGCPDRVPDNVPFASGQNEGQKTDTSSLLFSSLNSEIKKKGRPKKTKPDLPPVPEQIDTPEFRVAWSDWITHRTEIGEPLTPTTAAKQLAKFCRWGVERSVIAIEHTIEMGWVGLREPDATRSRAGPSSHCDDASDEAAIAKYREWKGVS